MKQENEKMPATMNHASHWLGKAVSRRTFIRTTAALTVGTFFGKPLFKENATHAEHFGDPVLVETDPRVTIKYSVCQGCHGRCGIRCKIVDGILVKIDGSPYNPCNSEPHIAYDTPLDEARFMPARICAKGAAGMQTLYDPYRLKEPLKRVGPRGSGQWETISWDQAFQEIGAKLQQYRDLNTPIDPNHPEFGKRVNQVVFSGGRNQQNQFTDRFWKNVFGTINFRHDHTSICETSHHVGHELTTGYGIAAKTKDHTKPDLANTEFMLVFGSDFCQANFPFTPLARKYIDMIERGAKVYVVDPICNIMASKANWIPIRPGVDAALALGIAREIIDNRWYNTEFLQRPHPNAANPTGEHSFSDATLLVKIVDGHPRGRRPARRLGRRVVRSDLLPGEVQVNGFTCKTAFELYVDRVREMTVEQYAAICGVDAELIRTLAREFAAAGRRGVATMYRGAVQHTNGTYTARAILSLNLLQGNFNCQGGLSFGGGGYRTSGADLPFPAPNDVPNGVSASGLQVTRVKAKYEDSTEFAQHGYPAQRPWFPLALHYNYQEIIPSLAEKYPYPCKALILYWNGLPYSAPAAKKIWEDLVKDENNIELLVGIDIAMGEATAWCDYVLPDTTYLERWSVVSVAPTITTKVSGVRQPVVGNVDPETGDYTPVLPNTKMLEDILIGLARTMGWPENLRNAWEYWGQLIENIAKDGANYDINYVLDRGGRFENYEYAYDGDALRNRFTDRVYFFSEYMAKTRDSMTGEYLDGLPKFEPITDVMGNVIPYTTSEFPLQLVTYKKGWHTQMHTIRYPWLVSIQPENFVEISRIDANARGINSGDFVLLKSEENPVGIIALAKVTECLCPGVVAVSHHFGHWEMSSKPSTIDNAQTPYDASRGKGITVNPLMRRDPLLGNVTLQDKIGGSASFYDTCVQVVKI